MSDFVNIVQNLFNIAAVFQNFAVVGISFSIGDYRGVTVIIYYGKSNLKSH